MQTRVYRPLTPGLQGEILKSRIWLIGLTVGLAVTVLCAIVFFYRADVSQPVVVQRDHAVRVVTDQTPSTVAPGSPSGDIVSAETSSAAAAAAESGSDEAGPTFRVDDAGKLILDEKTRLNIEALIAYTDPAKLYDATREQTKNLPPAAAQRAEEMVDRFNHYSQAQRQSYPPGIAPLTEEDALNQLDGLHALREAHFGPEVAEAFYADEEKLSRELIELMRLEKDQSLTLSEKAERAQALHDRLPTIAAIEAKNREDDARVQRTPKKTN
jgi:hypothetical protein